MNAKQTSMKAYGFTEWPPTHNRSHEASNCRASAAVAMREQGYGGTAIAKELGYCDKESACGSIRNFLRNKPAVRDSLNRFKTIGEKHD